MKNILVLYAHPSPSRSRLNRHLFAGATAMDHVEGRDLYELYPNLHIDVKAEQEALRRADIVIFQFPIFWFSSPAILKEWQDSVLTSGFAYDDGERVLEGKLFLVAATAGGSELSYSENGRHGAPIETYLAPFEQTARFCGMKVLDPFIVQGASDLDTEYRVQMMDQYSFRLIGLGKGHSGG